MFAVSTLYSRWRIWKQQRQKRRAYTAQHRAWVRNAQSLLHLDSKTLRDITGLEKRDLRHRIVAYRKQHDI